MLAAHRAGVKQVILPRRNEPDLEDVPREASDALRFVLAESAEEVLAAALGLGAPAGAGAPGRPSPRPGRQFTESGGSVRPGADAHRREPPRRSLP